MKAQSRAAQMAEMFAKPATRGRKTLQLGPCHQLGNCDLQGYGNFLKVDKRHVMFSALDAAHV